MGYHMYRCRLLMDGQRSADSALCAFTTFQHIPAPSTRPAPCGSSHSTAGGERGASTPAAEACRLDGSAGKPIDWR